MRYAINQCSVPAIVHALTTYTQDYYIVSPVDYVNHRLVVQANLGPYII